MQLKTRTELFFRYSVERDSFSRWQNEFLFLLIGQWVVQLKSAPPLSYNQSNQPLRPSSVTATVEIAKEGNKSSLFLNRNAQVLHLLTTLQPYEVDTRA